MRNTGARPPSAIGNPQSAISRRGFSFTEVLFAVMILGIGFIMVAAIFPVAIQQAKTSTEETTGAAVARGAATLLEQIATNSTMPATGLSNIVVGPDYDGLPPVFPPGDVDSDGYTISLALRGSLIATSDSRYAWVPFYRRAGDPANRATWSPVAQVFMVPVLMRNQSEFSIAPLVVQETGNKMGQAPILGDMLDGQNGAADTIEFRSNLDVPSEGAYVIIADATRPGQTRWNLQMAPHLHGRIYRLGNRSPDNPAAKWELMPGFDFEPVRIDADLNRTNGAPPNPRDGKETVVSDVPDARFFVIGRGLDSGGTFREGPAQDIAAYTTIISVKD